MSASVSPLQQLEKKKFSIPMHGHSTCAADPEVVLWKDVLAALAVPVVPHPEYVRCGMHGHVFGCSKPTYHRADAVHELVLPPLDEAPHATPPEFASEAEYQSHTPGCQARRFGRLNRDACTCDLKKAVPRQSEMPKAYREHFQWRHGGSTLSGGENNGHTTMDPTICPHPDCVAERACERCGKVQIQSRF